METKARGRAEYPVRRHGPDLPPEPPSGRSRLYFDKLLEVKADDDQPNGCWYELANYETRGGAKDACEAIQAGQREIPPGKWVFEPRHADVRGKKGSVLWVMYQGEIEESAQEPTQEPAQEPTEE